MQYEVDKPKARNFSAFDDTDMETNKEGLEFLLGKYQKQFMGSSFRKIRATEGVQIVISQDALDIAKMSTDRDWVSCTQLPQGEQAYKVPEEAQDGGLIAYVIKEGDEDIEEPLARVLIRRFTDRKGNDIAIAEKNYYGNAPYGFLEQVNDWIESKQGRPPRGDYFLQGMDYSDSLGHMQTIARLILERLRKESKGRNWYKVAALAVNI